MDDLAVQTLARPIEGPYPDCGIHVLESSALLRVSGATERRLKLCCVTLGVRCLRQRTCELSGDEFSSPFKG